MKYRKKPVVIDAIQWIGENQKGKGYLYFSPESSKVIEIQEKDKARYDALCY